jgi:hypothetical protein
LPKAHGSAKTPAANGENRVSNASGGAKKKGPFAQVKERGMALGMKLMNDPKNQQRVLKAIDAYQRSKSQIEALAADVLHFYNLPTQKDLKALGKKLTALRKEAAEIRRMLQEREEG